MDVDPGHKYIETFRGGVQWHMMESKDIISSIRFKLKNEIVISVSFNGQSVTFRLSIKKFQFIDTYNYICYYTRVYSQL